MSSLSKTRAPSATLIIGVSALLAIGVLIVQAVMAGGFGVLGPNPDDMMRYVQIRDWMAGQSWFSTDQTRMGPVPGTDMHWSRLPDVPIAALALLFDLFTDRETALRWAAIVWPPILGGLLMVVLGRGALHMADRSGGTARTPILIATLMLGLVFLTLMQHFEPSSIDHHNVQIVCLLASVAALVDPTRFRSGLIAGIMLALSVAVGGEVYVFAALICGFVALDWAILGEDRAVRTQGFGIGFGLGLVGIFLITVAPRDWALTYCDQLSDITALAALIGGVGLALSAKALSSRSLIWRLAALGVIGVACIVLLLTTAPQCLANPLDALPERVQTYWLDTVDEAKPIMETDVPFYMNLPFLIGTGIVALIVLTLRSLRQGLSSERMLFLTLIAATIAFSFYQVRFFFFVHTFALLPLGAWVGRCYASARQAGGGLGYIGAAALSVPTLLTMPGIALQSVIDPQAEDIQPAVGSCVDSSVIDTLNSLPIGMVSTTANASADILLQTEHSALSGNYHRNIDGLLAQIDIWLAAPGVARAKLAEVDADYLYFCEADGGMGRIFRDAPAGFAGQLKDGIVPEWLEPIGTNGIYKIK